MNEQRGLLAAANAYPSAMWGEPITESPVAQPDASFTQADLDSYLSMITDVDGFEKQARATGVPGLESHVKEIFAAGGGDPLSGSGFSFPWLDALHAIDQAQNDPASYAAGRLRMLSAQYTYGTLPGYEDHYAKQYGGRAEKNLQEIKDLAGYLVQNNISNPADINSWAADGAQQAANEMARQQAAGRGGSFKDVLGFFAPVILGFAIPGLGASLGAALAPTVSAATQAALGAGLLSGAMAEATGGDFLKGAIAGGLGSIASSVANPAISGAFGGGVPGNIVANAITSGAIAEVTGGDFADGALAGAASAGIAGLAREVPGFKDLDKRAQNAIISSATSLATTGQISQAQLMKALGSAVASTMASGQAPNSSDFIEGYFAPGGEGYGLDMTTDSLGETPSNQDILDAIGYAPEGYEPEEGVQPWLTEETPDQDLTSEEAQSLWWEGAPEMVVTAPKPEAEPETEIPEMVVTAPRPEAEPDWSGYANLTAEELAKLYATNPEAPPAAVKPPAVTPPKAVNPPEKTAPATGTPSQGGFDLQSLLSTLSGGSASQVSSTPTVTSGQDNSADVQLMQNIFGTTLSAPPAGDVNTQTRDLARLLRS